MFSVKVRFEVYISFIRNYAHYVRFILINNRSVLSVKVRFDVYIKFTGYYAHHLLYNVSVKNGRSYALLATINITCVHDKTIWHWSQLSLNVKQNNICEIKEYSILYRLSSSGIYIPICVHRIIRQIRIQNDN